MPDIILKDFDLTPSHVEKLQAMVKSWTQPVAIIIAQIDPDGTACGKLAKAVYEHLGAEVAGVYYAGAVGHRQNEAIFENFNLATEIFPIEKMPTDCLQVLVDSSKLADDSRLKDTGYRLDRVVGVYDHHPNAKPTGANGIERVFWNAPCSAATTLLWILAQKTGTPINQELATLAAIGIYEDSSRLASEHVKEVDIESFCQARKLGSTELFFKCCRFRFSKRSRTFLAEILLNCEDIGPYQIAHPSSHLDDEDGDDISTFADHLHRYEGSHTTIVWGLCGEWLRFSIRSDSTGIADLLADLCGREMSGAKHGSGGGRFHLPTALIPTDDDGAEKFIAFFRAQCIAKLKERVGKTKEAAKASDSKKAPA
ncbi:MAG TPA: hypothetical protein VJ694_04805 [Patescibacteria group bacterium]|nr:hypothetical protein [Patescibacteria group bacterium]